MTPYALGLVFVSTFMHAGWNLLARRGRQEQQYFREILFVVVALGFVPSVLAEIGCGPLPGRAYLCVAASGLCGSVYFLGLGKAYGRTDFTVVYPVARALPVLLIGLGDMLRGRFPTWLGWVGMGLVVGGCLMAPLHTLRQIRRVSYLNRANLWILVTALGTVGYTFLDKYAAEAVAKGPISAARYGYLYFASSALAYEVLLRPFWRDGGKRSMVPKDWLSSGGAVLSFGAYWLVLWAYQLADRASYIVAFRKFSIVLGVVAAFFLFRERGAPVRVTAALTICAGLVIIGVWG